MKTFSPIPCTSGSTQAETNKNATMIAARELRKRKDIKRTSFSCDVLQVRHRTAPAGTGHFISGVEVRRYDRPSPAADPREDRDILASVRAPIGHRLADDARACFELPQQITSARVHRFEPAVHRPVEREVA